MNKPNYEDVDYLDKVCRYCDEYAEFEVNFKDGTKVLSCSKHANQFVLSPAVENVLARNLP